MTSGVRSHRPRRPQHPRCWRRCPRPARSGTSAGRPAASAVARLEASVGELEVDGSPTKSSPRRSKLRLRRRTPQRRRACRRRGPPRRQRPAPSSLEEIIDELGAMAGAVLATADAGGRCLPVACVGRAGANARGEEITNPGGVVGVVSVRRYRRIIHIVKLRLRWGVFYTKGDATHELRCVEVRRS